MAKVKRAASSYVLLAGLLALVIVGAWMSYTIAAGLFKSQKTEVQKKLIAPLDGTLKETPLENLDSRRKFTNTELNAVILSSNVTVTPAASPSGTLNNRKQ